MLTKKNTFELPPGLLDFGIFPNKSEQNNPKKTNDQARSKGQQPKVNSPVIPDTMTVVKLINQ